MYRLVVVPASAHAASEEMTMAVRIRFFMSKGSLEKVGRYRIVMPHVYEIGLALHDGGAGVGPDPEGASLHGFPGVAGNTVPPTYEK